MLDACLLDLFMSTSSLIRRISASSRFKWQFNDFVCGNVSLNNYEFLHNFYNRVGNDDWSPAQLLTEILRIRDDDLEYSLVMAEGCQRQN